MTLLPAQVFGLVDRGRVCPGAYADLVLFDPDRVRDRSTYEEPRLRAEGIAHVLVNGRQAWPPVGGDAPGSWGRFLPGPGAAVPQTFPVQPDPGAAAPHGLSV
jgi:N-acyl-D-aspartate/D-glutamate deacylase